MVGERADSGREIAERRMQTSQKLKRGTMQKQRSALVGLLLLWCMALILYRIHLASDKLPIWLLGNICLAAVPMLFSSAFRAANVRKRPLLAYIFLFLWLLFLPNAPYIMTDLIHLAPHDNVPLWYDLAMLWFCAGTGVLFGYLSLMDVQNVIDRRFSKTVGWAVACGSLMLCGFGIYVGRFLRWNSWNAITNPIQLVKSMIGVFIDSGTHPHPVPVTLIFGIGLIVGYMALRVIATSMRTPM